MHLHIENFRDWQRISAITEDGVILARATYYPDTQKGKFYSRGALERERQGQSAWGTEVTNTTLSQLMDKVQREAT